MKQTLKFLLMDTVGVFVFRVVIDLILVGRAQMDTLYFISVALFAMLLGLLFRKGVVYQLMKDDEILESMLLKSIGIERYTWEEKVFESSASYFKGTIGIAGKLMLTQERLIFKSHGTTIQSHQQIIFIREIVEVSGAIKPNALAQNVIILHLASGEIHHFAVAAVEHWVEKIEVQKDGAFQSLRSF